MRSGGLMKHLGDKIRILRESRGLSQIQLADLLAVTNKSVSRYEIGSSEPKIDIILRIGELFDVDANYLLGMKNLYRNRNIVVTRMDMGILDCYHGLSDDRKGVVDYIFKQNKKEREKNKEKYLYVNDR